MLTASQVAPMLGISQRAVYELAATGALPAHKPTAGGRAVRFDPADVDVYKTSLPDAKPLLTGRVLREYLRLSRIAESAGGQKMAPLRPEQEAMIEKRIRNMRSPPWADRKAIEAIYAEAKRLTIETGRIHHVDHEIPLNGEFVSGLHVETNLRVLLGAENLKKGNKVETC